MLSPCFNEYVLPVRRDVESTLGELVNDGRDWFHSFRFSSGLTTPGRDPSSKKLHHLCLPSKLSGLTVLDVGAYEGYFSFHMEQLGAEKVVAADEFVWSWLGTPAKPHFDGVRQALSSEVIDITTSVENLSLNIHETFDIVLFLGVLYHAPNMIEYLKQIRSMTRGVCILETYLDMLDVEAPAAEFFPAGAISNDSSNWWGPNVAAVAGMCERAGFAHTAFVNLWDINTRNQLKGGSPWGAIKSGRGVFYAYC